MYRTSCPDLILTTELWHVQECLEKINQKDIHVTWKLRKREQTFLCATGHADLIYIPINLYDNTLTVTELWHLQGCLEKINQMGKILQTN